MSEKVCRSCRERLPLASFAERIDQGVTRRRASCRVCSDRVRAARDATPKARLRACEITKQKQGVRRAMLTEIRLASGCVDCGYNAHHSALDFDHLPGTEKKFPIMRDGLTRNLESLMNEVAKCEVVCANCHRVRTWRRRQEAA